MPVEAKIPSLSNKENVMKTSSFLFLVFFSMLSSATDITPAPVWEDGFSWEYQVTPSNGPQHTRTDTVISVEGNGYILQIEEAGKQRQAFYRKDGNLEASKIEYYKFPLTVGDSWKQEFEYTGQKNKKNYTAQVEVQVVAIERITTPAGEFDAFKIVSTMHYTQLDTSYRNKVVDTNWYAPKVRKTVRFESIDYGSADAKRTVLELIRCSLC